MTVQGLTETEAKARLRAEGYNELPRADSRTPWRIVLEVLREPMLALLLLGGVVYMVLGDLKEAIILLSFAMLSIVITVVQETRTERVLEALRDLTSPRASVVRDGVQKRIAGREVVRGDVILLAEGDRVPADAVLTACHDLQTDESLLTGESVPVRKMAGTATSEIHRPGGDDLPTVFSGTLIVRGAGTAAVVATGSRSEIGRIGQSLRTLESEPPRLQAETAKLVRLCAIGGGILCLLTVVLYGTMRGSWLDAILAGIALGMAMLPEEFPVVLTVFMAMGAWRISRARVLTRRAAAIETLGSATVLCTDKTGTLTENRMTIVETDPPAGDIVAFGVLASAQEPTDPMEKAFRIAGPPPAAGWKLVHRYGLRPDLLAMSNVWRTPDGVVVAAKGAPEAIAALCRIEPNRHAIDDMAARGLRVLGVARAVFSGAEYPESQRDFAFEFVGLVGLADPLRPSVVGAVEECRSAGIRVAMITGDYPATARAIARQAGLDAEEILTGNDVSAMDDAQLVERVRTVTVFARIMPEQKLRIVTALKADGEVVAMTGDGVNDAPSLKAAHIGIAMGGRGTDVAREASSIVLLDDDFGSVVQAVRLGRRIYDNLRKAMGFIFAVHVPIAGLALLPLAFGLPVVLGPIHIAFLEMAIDPVCSLVFEAETEEADIMRRKPRDPNAPLFSGTLIAWGILQGLAAFALVGTIFVVALRRGMPEDEVRALTFFSLVLTIVALIFVNRSFGASPLVALRRPNPVLAFVLVAVAAMLGVALLWPVARDLFRFGPLHADDLSLTFGAGVLVLAVLEGAKALWHRRSNTD